MKNGEFIRELRLKRNLTQVQLALKIGASKQFINNLEKSDDFNFSTLQKIVEALDFKIMAIPIENIAVEPIFDN